MQLIAESYLAQDIRLLKHFETLFCRKSFKVDTVKNTYTFVKRKFLSKKKYTRRK